MREKAWWRMGPKTPMMTCCECGELRAWCKTFMRGKSGALDYVCKTCWTEKGYGSPAAKPHYLRIDECPVVQ